MNESKNGERRMDQLPYYQEYIEQILRPRVLQVLEDVRGRLLEHAWHDLLTQIASDQGDSSPDPASLDRLRAMLESSLRLQIGVHVNVGFDGDGADHASGRADSGGRQNVDVVDRSFPDNPLAQAVGSVRRVNR